MSTQPVLTYSIKEASSLTGMPSSTLRYYESIGIIKPIARDVSSKQRVYTEQDLDILTSVACLSATGMSLDDMRTYIGNRDKGALAADEQTKLLETQKARLIEESKFLKIRQQYVDLKIAYWHAIKTGDNSEAENIAARAKVLVQSLRKDSK